jgi:hypothetical protein
MFSTMSILSHANICQDQMFEISVLPSGKFAAHPNLL